jgi:dihydroorotate dehydrogenase
MLTLAELLARTDHYIRPLMALLPPHIAVQVYSQGRNYFLENFFADTPPIYAPRKAHEIVLWGLRFRSPICNAAGIFKNGEGYDMVYRQGAGAYLAGTTTTYPRSGNTKAGIAKPFAPYPRSHSASNWLGLPNDGHTAVAQRLAQLPRYENFPIGVSIMSAPESSGQAALEELVQAMHEYDSARIDFIELNESCPNTSNSDEHKSWSAMVERLHFLSEHFLHKRTRRLPIIVKYSSDTDIAQIAPLIDILRSLGYDGINIGNTSTRYAHHAESIHSHEKKLYEYFTQTFGGGVSGVPVKASALSCVRVAAEHCRTISHEREFHIISTGGIETAYDVRTAQVSGAALCQWYTGYFAQFAKHGHNVYQHIYEAL